MNVYAGIGSRRAPIDMVQLADLAAHALRERGWRLRSGHAPGMDQAWEGGAYVDAEVYLPWPSFESTVPIDAAFILDRPTDAALRLAATFHPNWSRLTHGVRALHARNCHQVLGWDLRSPAKCVICWTPDGSLDGSGPDTGGTGQALRIAAAHEIPVFNLQRDDHRERVESLLELT